MKPELTEWVKKSGVRVELNDSDASVNYAIENGWELFSETEEGLAEAKAVLATAKKRAEATVAAAEKKAKK